MINIAILGFGTIGSGVAEVVEQNQAEIQKILGGENLHVKYPRHSRCSQRHRNNH